jgi:hypothetical protein
VHVHGTGDDVEGTDFEGGDFTVDHYVDRTGQVEFYTAHGSA